LMSLFLFGCLIELVGGTNRPAGLGVASIFKQCGVECVILERGKVRSHSPL
jgi:hypothetical protein